MVLTMKEALSTLGIKDVGDHPPKMKFIQKRFYQLCLIHHPDRPGGNNLIQQKIAEAFTFIGDHIVNNYANIDDEEEESARNVYKNFDFSSVKENIYSFTIKIDNNHSHLWDAVLSAHYGPPVDRKTNGKHWKHHDYSDENSNTGEISIGKWHIPKKDKQSKINIQSNTAGNLLPAHFVSHHFSRLLEEVNAMATAKSLSLENSSSHFSCAICDHQAKTQSQLNTHIRRSHKKNQGSLNHPDAPHGNQKKAPKFVIHPPMNVLPSTPVTLKCEVCGNIFYKEEYLKEHMNSIHKNTDTRSDEDVPCFLCGKAFADPSEATSHIQTHHEIHCKICDRIFYDQYDLNLHDLSVHKTLSSAAPQESLNEPNDENEADLQQLAHNLLLDFHASSIGEPPLSCEYCNLILPPNDDLNLPPGSTHDQGTYPVDSEHEDECGNCCNISIPGNDSNVHLQGTHESMQVDSFFPCDLCGITFTLTDDLNEHIQRRHMIQANSTSSLATDTFVKFNQIPARLLEEQIDMALSLKMFQETTSAQLCDIRETQEILKATLNQIIHDSTISRSNISSSLESLQVSVNKLASQVCAPPVTANSYSSFSNRDHPLCIENPRSDRSVTTPCLISNPSPEPSCSSLPLNSSLISSPNQTAPETISSLEDPIRTKKSNTVEYSSRTTVPPTVPRSSPPARPSSTETRGRIPTSKREKVLFIADSIGRNSDIRHLEEATNTLIYVEKAYGAHYKMNALFPDQNFCQVAPNVALKRDYKYAVFQGASIDITNLDTTNHTTANEAFWHQEVLISSQNMISAAEALIHTNPSIETVHILDRIPRFDPGNLDPSSFKQVLSDYGNKALREAVMKSPLKNRIFIQSHSLPGHCLEEAYGSPLIRGYDGVHMYGPKGRDLYTRSVCNIFQKIFSKHARSSHDHRFPTIRNTGINRPLPTPTTITIPAPITCLSSNLPEVDYSSQTNPHSHKLKHVIIEIESENNQNDENLQLYYSIPTSNTFSILGNYR